tara:strand:- start:1892 stop:2176 length:285 start_codon:yes stop_codon:yes gene_type:complete
MDNRTIVALGALMLVIILGLAFYWYEYRPSQIRATCETWATEQAAQFFGEVMESMFPEKVLEEFLPEGLPEGLYAEANKEAFYLSCIREYGLER